MPSSGMLHRVVLVRIDVSEECIASIIRVTRIGELGTTLAVTSNRSSVPTRNSNPSRDKIFVLFMWPTPTTGPNDRDMKLTIRIHIVPSLRIHGIAHPLHRVFMAQCLRVKQRDNFAISQLF
jgi:hypothetical protein